MTLVPAKKKGPLSRLKVGTTTSTTMCTATTPASTLYPTAKESDNFHSLGLIRKKEEQKQRQTFYLIAFPYPQLLLHS